MDDTLLKDFTLPEHKSVMDRIVFLPYTFKELKEVELVEFSGDVRFRYHAIHHRLNGSATVVGCQELERAFGAKHSEDDEFKATKIMQKQLLRITPTIFYLYLRRKMRIRS
ncbi:hypothetical protein R1sor_016746 [Riccia sorocarpa]|uniref:Uncharacterized protein n=1 Tax=Riccia sorocarpa TaxID=122646 RepID=A0ABD3HFY8_9MARC